MKNSLHKIFYLIALSLVSCNDDPNVEIGNITGDGAGSPITFSAGVAATKASALKNKDFSKFRLLAYCSDDSQYFDTSLSRDVADNTCSFDDTTVSYIWPEDASKMPLSFYGLFPYENLSPSRDDNGVYVSYESPYYEAEQSDLIAATTQSNDTSRPVALAFDHILSKINFSLTLNNSEVNIRDVKLYYAYKQLANSGKYYFDTKKWGDVDGAGKYSTEYSFETYRPNTVGEKHVYDKSLFVIPQNVSSESGYLSVRVEYGIYNEETLNHTVQTSQLALINSELAPTLTDKWEAGREYTYNLSINSSNEISFSLTIDDRDDKLAQGNIDLQYVSNYLDVTSRVETLSLDNVVDLVIAGSYSNGVLGFGSSTCPFIYGFGDEYVWTYRLATPGETATHVYDPATGEYRYAAPGEIAEYVIDSGYYQYGSSIDENKLFSVDMRLMTNLPEFSIMHGGEPDNSGVDPEAYIDGDAPSFPKYVFQYAERLRDVTLPENVISIGDFAFQNCHHLETINIFGAKHVELCAFQNCTSLVNVITNTITTSDGDKVGTLTRIHDNGFDNCTELRNIDLSNVREVDSHGFVNCVNLGEVDLGKVTIIGINAFDGCEKMNIKAGTVIPNLETISDFAFAKCATLGLNRDIVINNAVTIGKHAFNGCGNLFLGNTPEEYELAEINYIGEYAFQNCTKIENIDINNVEHIGHSTFYGCTNMRFALDFAYDKLTHIGESAFQFCPNLCANSKISINAPGVVTLGPKAFYDCTDFDFIGTDTQIFSGLTVINDAIFSGCVTLDNPLEFTNPAVTSIGASSFSRCANLPYVTITPENITSIGDKAFFSCTNMSKFDFNPTIVTSIGVEAFQGCENMVVNGGGDLTFSKITAINENSFNNCKAMSNKMIFTDKLTSIGSNALAGSGITSITGLDKVSSLGGSAFQDCAQLSGTLSLPSVTSLYGQWSTFYGCSSLKSIELGLTAGGSIGGCTFQNCYNLESITGLDYITEVPFYAFNGCWALKELNLPEVTTSGDGAFDGCVALTTFHAPKLDKSLDSILPYTSIKNLVSVELGFTGAFGGYVGADAAAGIVGGQYSNYKKLEVLKYPNATAVNGGTFSDPCANYKEIYLPKVSQVGESSMKGLATCKLTIGTEADADLTFGTWVFANTSGIDLHIAAPGVGSNYTISGNTLTVIDNWSYTFNSITVY